MKKGRIVKFIIVICVIIYNDNAYKANDKLRTLRVIF